MFGNEQLSVFTHMQESVMMDTCIIHDHSAAAVNEFGNPTNTYTARGEATICGFKRVGSAEMLQGNESPTIDAELRLPRATLIDALDRVQLTKRYGTVMPTPLLFDVVGVAIPGPSAILLSLKAVSL